MTHQNKQKYATTCDQLVTLLAFHDAPALDTLKEKQLNVDLRNHKFGKKSLIDLGNPIGRGELRLNLENIEAINQYPTPNSLIKVSVSWEKLNT